MYKFSKNDKELVYSSFKKENNAVMIKKSKQKQ